jgi:hypothetical protein
LTYSALKTGYDTNTHNRLKPAVPEVFLQLQFKDPENDIIDFPKGVDVVVEYGGDATKRYEGKTEDKGLLRFTATQVERATVTIATWPQWKTFTLRFDTTTYTQYIVCDRSKPAVAKICTDNPDPANAAKVPSPPGPEYRFFSLPRKCKLKQIDLDSAPAIPADQGTWKDADGTISHKDIADLKDWKDIGTEASPIKIVLKPLWLFLRYEFFDRRFGPAPRAGGAGGHRAKVTVPPLILEGFRTKPDPGAPDPALADLNSPDFGYVKSNWTVKDNTNRVQCLPWFLARKDNLSNMDDFLGTKLGIRFQFPDEQTFIYSVDENTRNIIHVNPDPDPGPQRLRHYRLPKLWKSKNYYTRNAGGGDKFFGELTTGNITAAVNVGAALRFCLDDIVLTDNTMAVLPLNAADRVTVYHHRFANLGGDIKDPEGVWKSGAGVVVDQAYPWSDFTMITADKYGGAAAKKFYIHDYPDWTRLVLANGNMFDAFDARTPDTAPVVGARAAVRWVDATAAPNGLAAGTNFGTPYAAPRPGIFVRPTPDKKGLFAIQPFYWQHFMTSYNDANQVPGPLKHNEWAASYPAASQKDQIGRFDMALLRCSDVDSATEEEIAAVIRYHRCSFDFTTVASPGMPQDAWIKLFCDNVSARWNGHDGTMPANNAPAWIMPRTPPKPPLQIQIVSIYQHLKKAWAHWYITILPSAGRSSMGEVDGTGGLRQNCVIQDSGPPPVNDAWGVGTTGRGLAAAHEFGHCGSLADEYIEDSTHSPNASVKNLLGTPYIHEKEANGKGLMHGNWFIRARYLWHSAEWLRLVPALATVDFKIQHPPENNYFIPHYPRDAAPAVYRYRNFVNWPVAWNYRAHIGGNTLFDAVLWIFGDDRYSNQVLPSKIAGGGGGRIDGMLSVLLKILVDFTNLPATLTAADRQAFRTKVFTLLETNYFTNQLCFRRVANFQVSAGARAEVPSFDRCLVHFIPCFYTAGTGDDSPTGATDLINTAPPHLRVTFSAAGPLETWTPPAGWSPAPAGPPTLNIRVPGALALAVAPVPAGTLAGAATAVSARIWTRCIELLGLTETSPPGAPDFFVGASFAPIVQGVMDAGVPPPVIF